MKKFGIYLFIFLLGIGYVVFMDSADQTNAAIHTPPPTPANAATTPISSSMAKERLLSNKYLYDSFDGNKYGWTFTDSTTMSIKNGVLVAASPGSTRNKAKLALGLPVNTDFEIELTVKWKSGHKGAGNGIEYVSCYKERKDFTVNAQGSFSASTYHKDTSSYVDEVSWTPHSAIRHGAADNTIKVIKQNGYTNYYVNGTRVGRVRFGTNCDTFDLTVFTDSGEAHYDDLIIKIL